MRRFILVVLLLASGSTLAHAQASAADDPTHHVVATDGAPAALGPYSQAIRAGNTLFTAGQIGIDPETGALADGGIEAETRRAMENLRAIVEAAGFSMDDVVQAQVYLVDLDEYATANEVYGSFFGEAPPARATVQVAGLPKGARIEIMLTAVR